MTNPTPTDVNTLIERLEVLEAAATGGPWAVTSTVGDVHSQARNVQNWICQGPNLHAPSTPPVSEIHANSALVAEVRNALPDLIQALRAMQARVGEWRSIDSEAPPHNKAVLLGWEDWRDGRWIMEAGAYSTGQQFSSGFSSVSNHGSATHWMPLPAAPSTQQEAQRHGE